MQQGRRGKWLNRSYVVGFREASDGNGALRVWVGLVIGQGEQVLIEWTRLDAVNTDMRETVCLQVEHNKYQPLSQASPNKL